MNLISIFTSHFALKQSSVHNFFQQETIRCRFLLHNVVRDLLTTLMNLVGLNINFLSITTFNKSCNKIENDGATLCVHTSRRSANT